jgi:LmbE family N-acetylglucosaminyl deacetylase
MARSTIILSPHFDDAVLSCWHLLNAASDVLVVNVFAGVPPRGTSVGWWDAITGRDDSRAVVRERAAEDQAALALAGRSSLNLDFLDRQYRSDSLDVGPIAGALRAVAPEDALLLAPAALMPTLGEAGAQEPHPDHVATRSAALALRAEGFEVALYADLPHASSLGWPDWVTTDGDLGLALRTAALWNAGLAATGLPLDRLTPDARRLTPAAFARKVEAVRRYASQVPAIEQAIGRRVDDASLLGYEVTWALPPLADPSSSGFDPSGSSSASAEERKSPPRSSPSSEPAI